MITEDYVSFETAKLLKERGFNETCRAFWKVWNGETNLCHCNSSHTFEYCHNSMLEQYNDAEETNIAAPTLQMAMKWLREVHNIFIEISVDEMLKDNGYQWALYYNSIKEIMPYANWEKSYEEACEAAIKYCLENLI